LSGSAKGGIEKMRSIFFQKTKSSGVPVIPPGGLSCGHKIGVVLWDEQTRVYRFRGFKIIAQGE
jgi:hypothetical protein